MIAFARGAWIGLRKVRIPAAVNTASNAAVNFVSRSRSRNLVRWAGGRGAIEQVHLEEVGGQDRCGLAVQELRPRWPCPSGRGRDTRPTQDLPHCGRRQRQTQAGQLPVNAPVAPGRVLPSETQDQPPDVAVSGWPSRSRRVGRRRPPPPDDVAMPTQHRLRRDDHPQPHPAGPRDHPQQRRQQCPISPSHPRSGRSSMPLQNRELMAQQQDLR
jgi:hypothetical protein